MPAIITLLSAAAPQLLIIGYAMRYYAQDIAITRCFSAVAWRMVECKNSRQQRGERR